MMKIWKMQRDMMERIIDVYEFAIERNIDGSVMYDLFSEKKNFNKLFILISETIYASKHDEEKILNAINYASEYLYEDKEHSKSLDWLRHIVYIDYCEKIKIKAYDENKNCNISEYMYKKIIINNFEKIFPEYEFIQSEKIISVGRIDILAIDKKTKKDVVMELKIGNSNTTRQLKAYSTCFDNPILVSVSTVEPTKKHNDIIYKIICPDEY